VPNPWRKVENRFKRASNKAKEGVLKKEMTLVKFLNRLLNEIFNIFVYYIKNICEKITTINTLYCGDKRCCPGDSSYLSAVSFRW